MLGVGLEYGTALDVSKNKANLTPPLLRQQNVVKFQTTSRAKNFFKKNEMPSPAIPRHPAELPRAIPLGGHGLLKRRSHGRPQYFFFHGLPWMTNATCHPIRIWW